jgi:hypothetical protein
VRSEKLKGLELSEKYYRTYGERMIKEKFPRCQDRIAAGLVGDGSECYGFDDEISRDHDWGPGFCLWLAADDYEAVGKALQREYEQLPRCFDGVERLASQWGGGRVGVFEIGAFYMQFIGFSHVPETFEQWLRIPEDYLSSCTNGSVFSDPLGEFSRIRNALLNFYPEDVRLAKIAARCMTAAQSGQYNFMRSVRRKAYFAAQHAESQFCSDIISLVFLLNKQYMPYYKWRHQAVRSLPLLGEFLYHRIDEIITSCDYNKKNEIIETICVEVIKVFHETGMSDVKSDFLLDHGPIIHKNIRDENLRKRNVWVA